MKPLLVLVCATAALAHDLYLMPRSFRLSPSGKTTIAFHNGDDFPEPDRPPKIENLLDTVTRTANGQTPLMNIRVAGKVLEAEASVAGQGSAIVTARTRPNLIELVAPKFESYLTHEGLEHVIRWRAEHNESAAVGRERYSKYVKSILVAGQADAFYREVVGFPIEIVPEADPASLKPGSVLPVRVLFRGQPAPDLQIETAWLPPGGPAHRTAAGRTDGEGRFRVQIGSRGVWKLHTVLMERCRDQQAADWESFWSSLTFNVD
jgi:hypothetical protein